MISALRVPRGWPLLLTIVLATACTLDASSKDACAVDDDCVSGFVCEQRLCVRRTGQDSSTGGGGEAGSTATAGNSGADASAGAAGSIAGGGSGGGGAGGGSGGGGNGGNGGSAGTGGSIGGGAGGSAGTGGGQRGGTGGGETSGSAGVDGSVGTGSGGIAGTGGNAGAAGTSGAGGGTSGIGGKGGGGTSGLGGNGSGGTAGVGGSGGGGISGTGGASSGTGGGGGGGASGTGGTGRVVGVCDASAVVTCTQASSCDATYCGGRLWQNGRGSASQYIPFRIRDPEGKFSFSYVSAIRAGAWAWANATGGLLSFEECTRCTGRFVSIVPGDGDGIANPEALEQVLPMPVLKSGALPSPHWIAHQWGHVVGLAHTYQRADRDRYLRFDPAVWCGAGASGLPPRCALTPQDAQLGGFSIAGDTFGAFDEMSKMNAFPVDGVCSGAGPDANAGAPTLGDASAAQELFYSVAWGWSPFRPIGRSVSPTQPLDYQLSPGVDPVGTPAIAEWDPWPEIFVRGTDDGIYTSRLDPPNARMSGWTDWEKVADDVESDPAAVFSDQTTVYLAFRPQGDSQVHLRARVDGNWGQPASIGAPPTGAVSAPAIAAHGTDSLYVAVMGGDGLVYFRDCDDASQLCAGTATSPSAWMALPPTPPGTFVGAPSTVWLPDNGALMLAAVGQDRRAYVVSYRPGDVGNWTEVTSLDLDPNDPRPGVTVQAIRNFATMGLWARGRNGLLFNTSFVYGYKYPIGGVLASVPAAVGQTQDPYRIDVAALIDDHGKPGVWWRFDAPGYNAPCNYNQPGTCGQCGL